ncbi:hypothetical protein BDR26DRAFT_565579 [Obelidium mucronatum]|nr:hypothetical protein BDR26DRAFT_565579 [Obelidium mucronatum]
MSALSDVSSVHSICSQGGNATDSDCDSEQALDLKLLGAKATHASIANHRVLKKLQAHLGVKIDKVVVVRIGRVLDPDTKKGDPLSICPRDRLELAFEIESILAEITSISYRLEYPALSIIAKDDSVWSYNPVSKSTILNCNPQNMRKIIKCDSPRFDQFMKVLEITLTLLRSDKTATKRDLYYRHVSLFKRQSTVDDIVESIACSFCVPRHNLHILASPKGLFKGPLRFYMKAELGNNMDVPYATNTATTTSTTTDCISGSNGGLIPLVTQITGIEYVPAKSPNTLDMIQPIKVLVIEKEATFTGVLGELSSKIRYAACSRPFEDMDLSVHNETVGGEEQDWVLITGKGYPDKNTHAFVNLLSRAEFRWVEINESNGQYGGQRRMGWWWSVPVMSPPTLLDMMDVVPDALLMFSDSDSDDEDGMMDIVPNKSSNLIDTHNNSDSDTDSDFDCDGNSWFAAPRSLSSQQLIPMDLVQSIRDSQHHLPVKIYGLFDCDPYGIDILMCYMFGSKVLVSRETLFEF